MNRRVGLRARTDFRVIATRGTRASSYRGIEVSPSGIVLDRGRTVSELDSPLLMQLELRLPERLKPVRALARPIWSFGTQQAFKFVRISDVDRLILAEHLDFMNLRGVALN
ncbi:MAG TPA: hypothetical protein VGM29_12605 [Polyangiaceae bacterium]|jgi:hypothetical protein